MGDAGPNYLQNTLGHLLIENVSARIMTPRRDMSISE
jgi:hypothetical protein